MVLMVARMTRMVVMCLPGMTEISLCVSSLPSSPTLSPTAHHCTTGFSGLCDTAGLPPTSLPGTRAIYSPKNGGGWKNYFWEVFFLQYLDTLKFGEKFFLSGGAFLKKESHQDKDKLTGNQVLSQEGVGKDNDFVEEYSARGTTDYTAHCCSDGQRCHRWADSSSLVSSPVTQILQTPPISAATDHDYSIGQQQLG